MNQENFEKLVTKIIKELNEILISKGKEYAKGTDRLSNFKDGAALLKTTPERALTGYTTKHIVTLFDIVNRLDNYQLQLCDYNKTKECITDILAYMILLKALLKERYENT